MFKTAAGIDFTIIPFPATPEVQVSLLQGNIALMIEGYSAMKGNLADNKIRALASSGPVRSEARRILPTVRESGVADYDVVSWNALFAPAGTPPEIIKTLNDALQDILADAGHQEAAARARHRSQERARRRKFQHRMKSDIVKWRKVIEKAGIQKQ